MRRVRPGRRLLFVVPLLAALILGASTGLIGTCGPFTDVAADAFCPFVLEIFTLGITTGTSPTTYDPTSNVSRLQMAAFLSRTVDGVLKRGGRRAALSQFSTPGNTIALGITTVPLNPIMVRFDGADLWVSHQNLGSVTRVRASDGKLLETWTGAVGAWGTIPVMGRVLVTGSTNPGGLYRIDPSQAAGAATTLATNLGGIPQEAAFDGSKVWVANFFLNAGVSIVTPAAGTPWTVTTVTAGFTRGSGILYDGSSVWYSDNAAGKLFRLDSAGNIMQTVTVGTGPGFSRFDGTNIWVPNSGSSSVTVVRAATGSVLQTLTGNGLNVPLSAAFDGQRILVTNVTGESVSLWKAADLTPLGFIATGAGTGPYGACSDGVNFWITFTSAHKLARF